METKILTEEQYRDLSKRLITTIERGYKIIPLNTLQHPQYALKRPVYITIEIENDTVIASLDDIEAFAYADTEYEAINSLCKEIIDIFEDLKDEKESLGILPGKWLCFLEGAIEHR